MILNIFVPHISVFVGMLLVYIKRCLDSGCSCGKRTKKNLKRDYMNLYIGPNFQLDTRYSQILVTIFVTLIYSPGMPILYICLFFFLFLCYFIDKWMILRFYRTPPKYDMLIVKLFNILVFISLIFHYAFGIWIYGNPNFLDDHSKTALDTVSNFIKDIFNVSDDSFAGEVVKRITMPHNILCLIFLSLIVFIILVRLTIYELIDVCGIQTRNKKMVQQKIDEKNVEAGLAVPVRSLFKTYELRKIQFMRMMKSQEIEQQNNNEIKFINNHLKLQEYFQNGINYDREFIKYKLEKLGNQEIYLLDKGYDENIYSVMENDKHTDKPLLEGETSYNIAVKFLILIFSMYLNSKE